MIYNLSLTTRKALKNTFRATTFKVEENSRTFQGKMEFKDFSRTSPKIQGLSKTLRTLFLVIACLYSLDFFTAVFAHGSIRQGHEWLTAVNPEEDKGFLCVWLLYYVNKLLPICK